MENVSDKAAETEVSRLFHREREGVYLFDWNISVSERGPLRPLEEIEDET
jgi:hypothetical protein